MHMHVCAFSLDKHKHLLPAKVSYGELKPLGPDGVT